MDTLDTQMLDTAETRIIFGLVLFEVIISMQAMQWILDGQEFEH